MERRQLRRMRKFELLELLLEQEQEIQLLQAENASLKEKLDIQQIKIEKAGSIAEAALSLSGVFEAAQEAADLYMKLLKNSTEASSSVETEQESKPKPKSKSKRGPTKRQRNRIRTEASAEKTEPKP